MKIRELELFRHLASTLHFGRTSQECNITPSGLTRTIQRLENDVGEPLFFRNNRSVHLTPAGMLFKEYCDESISNWHLFRGHLQNDSVLRGELSVYCSVTAILSILPQIFKRFRRTHPQVMLHVQTGDAAKALHRLQSQEVDISIAALPDCQPEGLDFIELLETPLLFIFPRFFPETIMYRQGVIHWPRTPIILPADGLSRTRAEKWFADKGIRPYIYSQVSGNEAIIAMVGMGCGVGIVPRLVLEKSSLINEVEILDINPQLQPFTVAACTSLKNKRNPLVQSFWNIVETAAATTFI
ncbi:HTH-type transcriptional activator IlvY [Desulfocastanea catecholica]